MMTPSAAPFDQAHFGSVGVETLLGAALTLHHENMADLSAIIAALTSRPAKLLGLELGTLTPDSPADFCLVDIDHPYAITAEKLRSKSKNTAIEGRKLQGVVRQTFIQGETVFKADPAA